jgi:hypothetical protein
VRTKLGIKAMSRDVTQLDGTYILREQSEAYGQDFLGARFDRALQAGLTRLKLKAREDNLRALAL